MITVKNNQLINEANENVVLHRDTRIQLKTKLPIKNYDGTPGMHMEEASSEAINFVKLLWAQPQYMTINNHSKPIIAQKEITYNELISVCENETELEILEKLQLAFKNKAAKIEKEAKIAKLKAELALLEE